MKLDVYTKTQSFLEYRLTAENNLIPYVEKFNSLLKENEFALVVINWKQTESLSDPLLQGRYLFVLSYNNALKKVIDSRFKLKNPNNIAYDYKTSKVLVDKDWVDGKVFIELTENYQELGGDNVANMFNNYWFEIYAKFGVTALEDKNDTHAIRFVLMLSREAFDNIKNQGEIINLMEKLKLDYVKGVSSY